MIIIKHLPQNSLKEYISYLMTTGNTSLLKVDDLRLTLFYFLDFLRTHSIYISITHSGTVVYQINKETNISKLLYVSEEYTTILDMYYIAIIKSFNHLENPF